MSRTITLELNDEVYSVIRRLANTAGASPARWLASALQQQYGRLRGRRVADPALTEADKQAARERFERHFGEVNLGYAIATDNERIDADLAREYANTHEEH